MPEPSTPPVGAPFIADTAIGDCAVALRPPSEEQRAVIDALRRAYGLESALYRRTDSLTSWEQVYSHYRDGFSDQLARQLADYSWAPESHSLRATHAAMVVPESVGVLELKRNDALVAWIPPDEFRLQWQVPRCIVDRLEREDDRWVVVGRGQ